MLITVIVQISYNDFKRLLFCDAGGQGIEMKRFGEKNTRFPGSRGDPVHYKQDQKREDSERIHFHNWLIETVNCKAALSILSKKLSKINQQ